MTNLYSDALHQFKKYLIENEKSAATMEKYLRDCKGFLLFLNGEELSKETVIRYKQSLIDSGNYAVSSINSMLSSVNAFLRVLNRQDCIVKIIRTQRQLYAAPERELTHGEYMQLLATAQPNRRLWLLLQTIGSTGVRVSEVQFFTVEAVQLGEITISCKGKTRTILIPRKLRKLLLQYCKVQRIVAGPIFCSKTGKALDRSVIWAMMKRLAARAGVALSKVFPHNLRHLFARTFYAVQKNIAALADVLGHSSINTTRIYIMVTAQEHQAAIDQLPLLAKSE